MEWKYDGETVGKLSTFPQASRDVMHLIFSIGTIPKDMKLLDRACNELTIKGNIVICTSVYKCKSSQLDKATILGYGDSQKEKILRRLMQNFFADLVLTEEIIRHMLMNDREIESTKGMKKQLHLIREALEYEQQLNENYNQEISVRQLQRFLGRSGYTICSPLPPLSKNGEFFKAKEKLLINFICD